MTQAFNLSQLANNLNSSGQLDATDGLVGVAPVANGGTGRSTLTANNVILGNGTSAVQQVAPGTSGNFLVSNGTTWESSAVAQFTGSTGQVFTSNGTFTIPTGITKVKVTVVGGGGGASAGDGDGGAGVGGSAGGAAIKYLTGLTPNATLIVTRGAGGAGGGGGSAPGSTGGTSSVVSGTQTITTISATGGSGGIYASGSMSGGVGSGGDLNWTGGTRISAGWCGGFSMMGYPSDGTAYGYGSGGSNSGVGGGAAGANGVVIFEW